MALYSVDIEKVLNGEYWTNRYIVDAASLAAAHTIGGDIVTIERAVHNTIVNFTKYRTSDHNPATDAYFVGPLNLPGLSAHTGDYLPLWNVMRVDFAVAGGGRPSRKYLRLPIFEDQQANGTLQGAFVSFVQSSYADALAALAGYVDVEGQEVIAGSVSPFVGMRQLRRGSKRRALPVIPG